jgi:ferrous iron transport protein A
MCARIAGRELTIPAELQASVRVVPANNRADSDETISLAELPSSRAGAVREIGGGGSFAARCLALGFTPGTRVQMVQNIGRGPVIVTVRDTRIALGRGEASAITVTPVD